MIAALLKMKKIEPDPFERYDHVKAQYGELRSRLSAIAKEIAEIKSARSAAHAAEESRIEDAVTEYLHSGTFDLTSNERRQQELEDEEKIVQRAMKVVHAEYEKLGRRLHAQKLAELAPAHRAAVQRIAAAIRELADANAAELDIHKQAREYGARVLAPISGAPAILPAADFPRIGNPENHNSAAWAWFRHVRKHGLIDE